MSKPYFIYVNHYLCPHCSHTWKLTGKENEVSYCKRCEEGKEHTIYPHECYEVDYDEM